MTTVRQFLQGLLLVGVGLFWLWQTLQSDNANRRLDANPHVSAKVERTWTSTGKRAARYADLSFPGPIGISDCHAAEVRLGPASLFVRAGQSIDVAPIPGTCAAPDVASARASGASLTLGYGGAFLAFMAGVMTLMGWFPTRAPKLSFGRSWG